MIFALMDALRIDELSKITINDIDKTEDNNCIMSEFQ